MNTLGIILIILSVLLFLSDFLDPFITYFTHIFLMGSSEGKDVLFFTLMGTMLILSPLFIEKGYLKHKLDKVSYFKQLNQNDFLKIAIILVVFTYIMGLVMEIMVRQQLDVSIFTTFISLIPSPTSTSLTHSHIFKASISPIIKNFIIVPSQIHTGTSLLQYVPPLGPIALITLPLVYIIGLFSLGHRRDFHKVILIFALATTMIGMIDGGLFSTPAMVGLSGLLGIQALKIPFSPRNLITPTVIIGLLIILRVFLSLMGSNTEYYEVTIIGSTEPINLDGYDVVSYQKEGDRIILHLAPHYNEMVLLNELTKSLEGKARGFFISWNFFSFF
nr:hypothetical protein [Methanobacterium alcaliphilum]